ncbi:RHS repeat-associated core domain-containing protein [Delftia tsuruhatensis]|nr:RHS repeat-associated core domain-containing protein [Delftia tsuruhatensis]
MQTTLSDVPRDMQQEAARHLRHTLEHSLQPSVQAILGEEAEGTTRLLSGMQAKLQEQERQQRIAISLPLRPTGHANGPDGPDRPSGLGSKLDPWGNVLQEYNPQGILQAIRLPGQHHDRETGLYYNRHRYYDPVVGSYINQDPIGLAGGSHNTSYPKSPTIAMDPLGLFDIAGGALDLWGVVSGRKSAKKRSCKCDAILKGGFNRSTQHTHQTFQQVF